MKDNKHRMTFIVGGHFFLQKPKNTYTKIILELNNKVKTESGIILIEVQRIIKEIPSKDPLTMKVDISFGIKGSFLIFNVIIEIIIMKKALKYSKVSGLTN